MRTIKEIKNGDYVLTHSWQYSDDGRKLTEFDLFDIKKRIHYPFMYVVPESRLREFSDGDSILPFSDEKYLEIMNDEINKINKNLSTKNTKDAIKKMERIIKESSTEDKRKMREFKTGATRNDDTDKLNFEGFLCPLVLKRYAEYMHKNRMQSDGKLRDADNWKKGMTLKCFMESGFRHFHDWWMEYEGHESREGLEDALCGLMFNVMGYLHETLKNKK